MNSSHWSTRGGVLAALVGIMLLAANPVQAQKRPTPRWNTQVLTPLQEGNRISAIELGFDPFAAESNKNAWFATVHDPADQVLGATLQPIDDTLRAQLGIPAGEGLLVASLQEDGAAARAGLKQNDILRDLGGQPLAAADDLTKQLKAVGDSPKSVPLSLIRAGKPMTIYVRPIYRVTLGPVAEQRTEYYIGVSVNAVDDAVRAQLALPEGQGVVVSEVVSGSPAEKATVQKHDIIIELGGKRIDSPPTLAREVQAIRDKPTTLKILRGGKPLTLTITAATRQVEASPPQENIRFWLTDAGNVQRYLNLAKVPQRDLNATASALSGTDDLRQRLDHLEQELKALRVAVDQMNETLSADKAKRRD
jgi:C-terminal processing protease CtpA/Prc